MRTYFLVGILAFCISTIYGSMPRGIFGGGISDSESEAGPQVQRFVEELSKEIKAGAFSTLASSGGNGNGSVDPKIFENASLTALTYKTQVVAGANYFVKLKLGDYIFHVKIYRDLQNKLSVNNVVGPKNLEDPIDYI